MVMVKEDLCQENKEDCSVLVFKSHLIRLRFAFCTACVNIAYTQALLKPHVRLFSPHIITGAGGQRTHPYLWLEVMDMLEIFLLDVLQPFSLCWQCFFIGMI